MRLAKGSIRVVLAAALAFLTPIHLIGQAGLRTSNTAWAGAPSDAEKQAFEAAKELGTIEAWEAFLNNYPGGFHADLARAYLKRMANTPPAAAPAAAPQVAAPPPPPVAAAAPVSEFPLIAGSWGGIVRSGPGENYERVTSLKEGEEVTLMAPGVPVRPNDYPWFRISYGENGNEGYMWGGILCSTGAERPDIFKLCTFTPVRATATNLRSKASKEDESDHGPTPVETCRQAGMDYNGTECVSRKKKSNKPSKATVERRARANCEEIGMVLLNGQCQPRKKKERDRARQNKNVPCPEGMYRNPYGQCQPNETGS